MPFDSQNHSTQSYGGEEGHGASSGESHSVVIRHPQLRRVGSPVTDCRVGLLTPPGLSGQVVETLTNNGESSSQAVARVTTAERTRVQGGGIRKRKEKGRGKKRPRGVGAKVRKDVSEVVVPRVEEVESEPRPHPTVGEIQSTVSLTVVEEWLTRYGINRPDFDIRVPQEGERANAAPTGFLTVYLSQIKGGFRFFVPPFFAEVFTFCGLCPSQLVSNSFRMLVGFWLCAERFGVPRTAEMFLSLFVIRPVYNAPLFFHFSPRSNMNFLTGSPTSAGMWKDKFFYLKPRGKDASIWGVPTDWQLEFREPAEETIGFLGKEAERLRLPARLFNIEKILLDTRLMLYGGFQYGAPPTNFNLSEAIEAYVESLSRKEGEGSTRSKKHSKKKSKKKKTTKGARQVVGGSSVGPSREQVVGEIAVFLEGGEANFAANEAEDLVSEGMPVADEVGIRSKEERAPLRKRVMWTSSEEFVPEGEEGGPASLGNEEEVVEAGGSMEAGLFEQDWGNRSVLRGLVLEKLHDVGDAQGFVPLHGASWIRTGLLGHNESQAETGVGGADHGDVSSHPLFPVRAIPVTVRDPREHVEEIVENLDSTQEPEHEEIVLQSIEVPVEVVPIRKASSGPSTKRMRRGSPCIEASILEIRGEAVAEGSIAETRVRRPSTTIGSTKEEVEVEEEVKTLGLPMLFHPLIKSHDEECAQVLEKVVHVEDRRILSNWVPEALRQSASKRLAELMALVDGLANAGEIARNKALESERKEEVMRTRLGVQDRIHEELRLRLEAREVQLEALTELADKRLATVVAGEQRRLELEARIARLVGLETRVHELEAQVAAHRHAREAAEQECQRVGEALLGAGQVQIVLRAELVTTQQRVAATVESHEHELSEVRAHHTHQIAKARENWEVETGARVSEPESRSVAAFKRSRSFEKILKAMAAQGYQSGFETCRDQFVNSGKLPEGCDLSFLNLLADGSGRLDYTQPRRGRGVRIDEAREAADLKPLVSTSPAPGLVVHVDTLTTPSNPESRRREIRVGKQPVVEGSNTSDSFDD